MVNRKKKNIVIGVLVSLVIFMGVGYAVLSQLLDIKGIGNLKGNWDIYIDSITPVINGTATSISSKIGSDKLSATFEAELTKPGDYVEYTIVVKNDGNIDAKLMTVIPTVTNSHEYITYSNTAQINTVLGAGESMSFKVKALFSNVSNIDENTTVRPVYDIRLGFAQHEQSPSGGGTVVASNWEYEEIQNNGVGTGNYRITGYTGDFDTDTTSVVVTENAVTAETLTGIDTMLGSMNIPIAAATNANYKGYALTIPSTIDGHPITSIGSSAFSAMNGGTINYKYLNITSLTIPEGITKIEDSNVDPPNGNLGGAFLGNFNLKTLSLPSTLTYVGEGAFMGNALESLILPSNLTNIGVYSFAMHNITSLTIPSTVTTIGEYAFQGGYALQATKSGGIATLILPVNGALTTIGSYAFDNNNLTTVSIPSTVTTIGEWAFSTNTNLTGITVNRSATGMTLGGYWCGIDDCTATGGRVTYSE